MRGALLVMLVLGACAHGGSAGAGDDSGDDQQPDAAPAPDACVPVTTQLLVNPALDATTQGMGWIEQRIQSGTPLVTDKDGRPEHTPPYKIWLGGMNAPIGGMVTDVLTQDVAIPPMTQELVLSGYHDVRTVEDPAETIAFDSATVTLTQLDGARIESLLTVSNLTPRTGWMAFEHKLAQIPSGQMVRLRFSSTSDGSWISSFYFDTLALTATHGCP
jgi:hypothetical protein